jgi:hypothetical protein
LQLLRLSPQTTSSLFLREFPLLIISLSVVAVAAPAVAVAVAVFCRSPAIRFHLVQHSQSESVLAVLAVRAV